MKQVLCMAFLMASIALTSCKSRILPEDNPLLSEFNTPFGVPPFDQIKVSHYLPAFEAGVREHKEEIEAIVCNEEAPDFENTLEALEYSGELLQKVWAVFANMKETEGTSEMDSLAQIMYPAISRHQDEILMNASLFQRIKTVYEQQNQETLDPVQKRLLSETYKSFVRNGANLSTPDQDRLKKINERLSELELGFENNVRAETNDFLLVLDSRDGLDGLSESFVSSMALEAKNRGMEGKWVVSLDAPSVLPFLQMSSRRDLREQVFMAYIQRGNRDNVADNKKNLAEQVKLRAEKASLLGYASFAAYILDDNMAGTPEAAMGLLKKIWDPALAVAKRELKDIQVLMNRDYPGEEAQGWDWRFYAEKVRKEKYDLEETMTRPYFQLENVLEGVFSVAGSLFGLSFIPLQNVPLPHSEALVFEVKDEDGAHLGVIYFDFFPRPTKGQGAWMTEFRTQCISKDGLNVRPVVSIVCNFTKPSDSEPSLLTVDEVETLFHEFGHGLHGLLSDNRYRSLAGTNVPTDFVELPSSMMENWCMHPEVLTRYARHYLTGEVIPADLVRRVTESRKFDQGFATAELTAAAILDQKYHLLPPEKAVVQDVHAFEQEVIRELGLISQIPPRYRSTYFKHIFGGGYSARYYSYLWSETLDADAFRLFEEKGIFDQETARSYRKNILEKGGSEDPMVLYKRFRGSEPDPEALLERRGLL